MSNLYWSCPEGTANSVLAKLHQLGRAQTSMGSGNGLCIIGIENPDVRLIADTLPMIAADLLRSGALVEQPLGSDEIWIASEWWGKFLVEETLSELVMSPSHFIQFELTEVRGRHFRIIRAQTATRDFEPVDKSTTDYWAGRPTPRSVILDDPARYYGDLAEEAIGGANALYAAGLEAARTRGLGSDMILLGEPEDFGFVRETSEDGVNAWRRKGIIDAHAVGFGLNNWDAVYALAEQHGVGNAIPAFQETAAEWLGQGCQFGVAVVLVGLEDPPVVIPTGAVYQQPTIGVQVQNLATAQSVTKMVAAGATVPIVLPAYCLNQSFSPPSGPVVPTSIIYSGASGSQQGVWEGIDARYRRSR